MTTFLIGILSNLEEQGLIQIQQQFLEAHPIQPLKICQKSGKVDIKDQQPACNRELYLAPQELVISVHQNLAPCRKWYLRMSLLQELNNLL